MIEALPLTSCPLEPPVPQVPLVLLVLSECGLQLDGRPLLSVRRHVATARNHDDLLHILAVQNAEQKVLVVCMDLMDFISYQIHI